MLSSLVHKIQQHCQKKQNHVNVNSGRIRIETVKKKMKKKDYYAYGTKLGK